MTRRTLDLSIQTYAPTVSQSARRTRISATLKTTMTNSEMELVCLRLRLKRSDVVHRGLDEKRELLDWCPKEKEGVGASAG